MNDPYFSTLTCVNKLLDQYALHKSLIVAFDFDDTIFDYFKKGYRYPMVIDLLYRCQELGFTLIMLTTKESDDSSFQVEYCESLGIFVKYVNEGPVMPKARKPFFNVYLDDKAGLRQAYEILEIVVDRIEYRNRQKLPQEAK